MTITNKRLRQKCKQKDINTPHEILKQKVHKASEHYVREIHLPRLIGLWPQELTDRSKAGQALILEKLKKALRIERKKGLSGHWSYDLNRHMALLQAYNAENKVN